MEQNADAEVPMAPVINDEQKSGNGLKIATMIGCIVAVCGIGFGIYGMVQSLQKDNQISNLKMQISEQKEEDEQKEDGTIVSNQRMEGYLSLDEFGIKINIPDDTIVTSYAYSSGYYGLAYTNIKDLGTYEIWFAPNNLNESADYSLFSTRDYAIRISRYLKDGYDCQVSCGEEIFTDDEYTFTIFPQVSTIGKYDGTIDEELNNIIGDFVYDQRTNGLGFFNKNNYSKI